MVTTDKIVELRKKTGAGMMDCKKALVESNGDLEKAMDILRKKGLQIASKKSSRAAKDGAIASYIHIKDFRTLSPSYNFLSPVYYLIFHTLDLVY